MSWVLVWPKLWAVRLPRWGRLTLRLGEKVYAFVQNPERRDLRGGRDAD